MSAFYGEGLPHCISKEDIKLRDPGTAAGGRRALFHVWRDSNSLPVLPVDPNQLLWNPTDLSWAHEFQDGGFGSKALGRFLSSGFLHLTALRRGNLFL